MATDAKDKGSVTGRNKDEQEEEGKQEQETLIIETEEELRALIENNVSYNYIYIKTFVCRMFVCQINPHFLYLPIRPHV